ncbi:MAG TPA: hypothetical protein VFG20_08645 [Planctomycetaceae bacterium]|nr:hypothetical protein [Planctomycetaceae bacterium]
MLYSSTMTVSVFLAMLASPLLADEPAEKESVVMTAWRDLEKDEPESTRALLQLSRDRIATMALLRGQLKPLKLTGDRMKELIVQLSNDDEKIWKPAFEELEYFDPRLALDLSTLMDIVQATPVRQRLVEILSGRQAGTLMNEDVTLRKIGDDAYNFVSGGSWWAEHKIERLKNQGWGNPKKKWTRALRAISLLEHFGTPEAVAILEDMATGHPEAHPTVAAKECLERLQRP